MERSEHLTQQQYILSECELSHITAWKVKIYNLKNKTKLWLNLFFPLLKKPDDVSNYHPLRLQVRNLAMRPEYYANKNTV